jgi:sterol desaturase/sphingolipid hydroxylase (fatty acid hydroxylase superfamily)
MPLHPSFGDTGWLDQFLPYAKPLVAVALLAVFWMWETWRPFFGQPEGRWQHAARNLALAICNSLVLSLVLGTVTLMVLDWTQRQRWGALQVVAWLPPLQWGLALLILDAWMYVWHRANHSLPLLWRFHRMHHSDLHMDVTTATRFHLGEHLGGAALRLLLIPLVGFELPHLLAYEALVIGMTQFHHADISLGRADRWLRWLVVTPDMHKVHHSNWRPETNSNYSTVLSVWDRLAGSFRLRTDLGTLKFGLSEFTDPRWQHWRGMWLTPFVTRCRPESEDAPE